MSSSGMGVYGVEWGQRKTMIDIQDGHKRQHGSRFHMTDI